MTVPHAAFRNGLAIRTETIPVLAVEDFRRFILEQCHVGGRLATLFGSSDGDAIRLTAVVARDQDSALLATATYLPRNGSYSALTPELPQAHWFERELGEQFSIQPLGHPWLKPLRVHADLEQRASAGETARQVEAGTSGQGERRKRRRRGSKSASHEMSPEQPQLSHGAPSDSYNFYQITGESVHEVAVGPVHAGIIEPAHFRLQCHGEEVLHLEIQLGYQHRGVETMLPKAMPARRLLLAESIAGDTCIGHGLAYCEAVEALADCTVPARALVLRGIALELERLANHVGDLGALGGDVGFLSTTAWFGRLRGDFLNMTMDLTGNRYGRGFLTPGGVLADLTPERVADFRQRLTKARADLEEICSVLFSRTTVLDRLEETGTLPRQAAEDLGLVGPAARASGCDRDVRRDHPHGVFRFAYIPVLRMTSGDVYARAWMNRGECEQSLQFLDEQLASLPDGPIRVECPPPRPDHFAAGMVEGWRGEILHCLQTDANGHIVRYKIKDPSFHNWMGLAIAMRGQAISDFPLCNKSFNLSYAGHDL